MPETCCSTVPQAISALRAKLSDAKDDQGILIGGNPNLTPDDSESITFPRTARQACHRDTPYRLCASYREEHLNPRMLWPSSILATGLPAGVERTRCGASVCSVAEPVLSECIA